MVRRYGLALAFSWMTLTGGIAQSPPINAVDDPFQSRPLMPIGDPFGLGAQELGAAPPVPFPAQRLLPIAGAPPIAGESGIVPLDVSRAGLAKINADGETLTLAVPAWRVEQRTRTFSVAKTRMETLTRKVPAGTPLPKDAIGSRTDGVIRATAARPSPRSESVGSPQDAPKSTLARTNATNTNDLMVTQTYQVSVPYTEQIEQRFNVLVPGDLKTLSVPVDKVTAWTRDGLKLDGRSLRKILASPRPVMRLRSSWPEDFKLNKAQQKTLANDILFLLIEPS